MFLLAVLSAVTLLIPLTPQKTACNAQDQHTVFDLSCVGGDTRS